MRPYRGGLMVSKVRDMQVTFLFDFNGSGRFWRW
jgi:hypothetical protein